MSHLRDLQLRFQDYLMGGSGAIEDDIVSTEGALAEHRLGTYYNAYRIRLIDSLAVDYAALEHYLGRESFENMALDYLQRYPSTQPSVRWFGQHLADFLQNYQVQGIDTDDAELVRELAQFEWMQTIVFDAADSPTLVQLEDMAQIAAENWPALTFKFKTALQWLDLYWNVPQIEHRLESGKPSPDRQRSQFPLRWLLWRRDYKTYWRSLEAPEAWALEQAFNGTNFADICEGLLEWIDAEQVALTAAGYLRQWINDQLLIRLHDS